MKAIFPLLGNGRIENIISALKQTYEVDNISSVSTEIKLETLCSALGLSTEEFDEMLANNSPVLRTVKGHAFEVAFEQILKCSNIFDK